jgi:hypothetical protein
MARDVGFTGPRRYRDHLLEHAGTTPSADGAASNAEGFFIEKHASPFGTTFNPAGTFPFQLQGI